MPSGQALPVVNWNTGDGNFGIAGNWDPIGVPDETERALFSPSGQITVTLDQSREVGSFQMEGSADGETQAQVIFNLNDFKLDLVSTETGFSDRSLTLRGTAGTTRTLTFENGTAEAQQVFLQAVGSELPTRLRLDNSATLIVNGTISAATSYIEVIGGSTLDTPSRLTLNATAEMMVSGSGSSWVSPTNETHFIGQNGDNGLTLSDGATTAVGRVNLGRDSSGSGGGFGGGGDGALMVEDAGTVFNSTELNIGGGVNSSGGNLVDSAGDSSIATFRNGGKGELTLLRNLGPGTLVIDGGLLEVGSGGATLYAGSTMQLIVHSDVAAMFVAEGLTITDSVLQVGFDESFTPFLGQIIPLVEYTALTGFFADINQGDTFMIGDTLVSFDYGSGTDDMISLSVIPEPKLYAAMAGLLCLAICTLRKRRQRAGN